MDKETRKGSIFWVASFVFVVVVSLAYGYFMLFTDKGQDYQKTKSQQRALAEKTRLAAIPEFTRNGSKIRIDSDKIKGIQDGKALTDVLNKACGKGTASKIKFDINSGGRSPSYLDAVEATCIGYQPGSWSYAVPAELPVMLSKLCKNPDDFTSNWRLVPEVAGGGVLGVCK